MRIVTLALIVGLGIALAGRAAADPCKPAAGRPIYRETHGPLTPTPDDAAQTDTFALFANGTWTWSRPGDAGNGGCITTTQLREVKRAIARARFRRPTEPTVTCDALPTARVVYAAPRRGKRITSEAPCGTPVDRTTQRMIECAHAVMQAAAPADADLRAICRGA